jgi:hypothetical protein
LGVCVRAYVQRGGCLYIHMSADTVVAGVALLIMSSNNMHPPINNMSPARFSGPLHFLETELVKNCFLEWLRLGLATLHLASLHVR